MNNKRNSFKTFGALLIVFFIIVFINVNNRVNEVEIVVSTNRFEEIYNSNDPRYLMVDLRNEEDYEKGHLDRFVNIPYSKGESTFVNFLDENQYNESTIVLMCYKSKSASKMFNYLYGKGYRKLILININSEELLNRNSSSIAMGPCNCLD